MYRTLVEDGDGTFAGFDFTSGYVFTYVTCFHFLVVLSCHRKNPVYSWR